MFNHGLKLPFKLLGIPVILDWSFLLILPILGYLIANNVPSLAVQFGLDPTGVFADRGAQLLIGLVAAVGLFVCVLLHELGHAVAARAYGIEVERITLWFLGGVAQMPEIPRQKGGEAVMAIAGPIVSAVLAGAFWVAAPLVSSESLGLRFVLQYLSMLNLVLAVFNLLPALPLDGGRVLRSLLAIPMGFHRATRAAGGVSKVIAVLLGLFGLLSLNIFLMAIAFFIFMAVSAETQMGRLELSLRGVPARRIMNPEVHVVSQEARITELLQRMLLEHHLSYPVVDETGSLRGIVTLLAAQGQPPEIRVAEVMTTAVPTVRESDDGVAVLKRMGQQGLNRVVVLDAHDRIAGLITKGDLMRFIMVREAMAEMRADPNRGPAAGASWTAKPA